MSISRKDVADTYRFYAVMAVIVAVAVAIGGYLIVSDMRDIANAIFNK